MLRPLLTTLATLLHSRSDLILEDLALRQQLAVLQARLPRHRMRAGDRLFWMVLRRLWPKWRQVLVLVKPETVLRWHRLGFRAFWRWRSRPRQPGRSKIDPKLHNLIRRMVRENPTWGAPRIHAELRLLGLEVAERTISRYLKRAPEPDAVERWKTFLRLHRKELVALDFFTVPGPLRPRLHTSLPMSRHPLRSDRLPYHRLDPPAAPRGLPVRDGTALPDPRP